MSVVRSEPLGWLAPFFVAVPAGAFGLMAGAEKDAPMLLVGAVSAVLAALCGGWGVRERRGSGRSSLGPS